MSFKCGGVYIYIKKMYVYTHKNISLIIYLSYWIVFSSKISPASVALYIIVDLSSFQ